MKLGERSAALLSQHNSMAILLNAALGSEKKGGAPSSPHDSNVKNLADGHADVASAVAAINQAMTI